MTKINPSVLVREAYHIHLEFTTEVLGMQPSESVAMEWVRKRSIGRKASELRREQNLSAKDAEREAERIVNESLNISPEEADESGVQVTVFHRDDVGLYMMDYQISGFFKEAAKRLDLKVPGKRAAAVSAQRFIAGGLWIFPVDRRHGRKLYFTRNHEYLREADRVLDRVKRVQTMQGEQTSIAASEVIDPPASLVFTVALLEGFPINREHLEKMLAYASFQGFGQWRGAGHGRAQATITKLETSEVHV